MSPKKRSHSGRWHGPTKKKKKKKVAPQQAITSSSTIAEAAVARPTATPSRESAPSAPRIEKMDETTMAKYRAIVADIRLIVILAAIAVALLVILSLVI